MNKKELIEKVTNVLQGNDIRKHVAAQKTTLHISDDYGNQSDFIIKKSSRGLLFTNKDVSTILDAVLAVVEDSLKRGEVVARYVPKFNFGNLLRMAAKVYEMSLVDEENET